MHLTDTYGLNLFRMQLCSEQLEGGKVEYCSDLIAMRMLLPLHLFNSLTKKPFFKNQQLAFTSPAAI